MINFIFIFFIALFSSDVFSINTAPILICEESSNKRWQQNCKINDLTIVHRANFEVEIDLRYDFKCPNVSLKNIGVLVEDTHEFRSLEGSSQMTLSGTGPFRFVDQDGDWTSFARIDSSCSFKILSVSVKAAQRAIEKAQSERADKQKILEDIEASIKGFENAMSYQSAFQIIKKTCDSLYAEMSSENLQELILSIRQTVPLISQIIATKAAFLTPDNIGVLIKFMALGNSATNDSLFFNQNNEAKKLEDLFHEEEWTFLKKFTSDHLAEEPSFKVELERFITKKIVLEKEIKAANVFLLENQ